MSNKNDGFKFKQFLIDNFGALIISISISASILTFTYFFYKCMIYLALRVG